MDDKTFAALAEATMGRVLAALDRQDPDVVEAVLEAGVVKIGFPAGPPFILNTQRPTREMWLAADRHAWHFKWDGTSWVDGKSGDELYATIARVVSVRTGTVVAI
jgi:CyaY protein